MQFQLTKAVERVETARENSHLFVKVIKDVTDEILGLANDSGYLTSVQRDIIQGYVTQLRRVRNA